MHRADLVALLADALPPGTVHTGHRCVAFAQDARARVTFANGATAQAEIVIAADGIHSELRPYVFPPSRPVFHGSVAYRGLVPHARIPHWPVERWQMWLGTGKHFLAFPVRAGQMINYVGFVPADEEMKESWSAPGDPDALRRDSPAGTRASRGCCRRCGQRSDGRSTTASRCRPGPKGG